MEFAILGPIQVLDDEGVRAVPAAKQRILLATLLTRRGQVVPSGLLAEMVWDGQPPRSAAITLRNYVMRLRSALGAAGGRIETLAGGYRINIEAEEFDAQRFVLLRDRGVAMLREGAFGRALELLDQALRLWRGPALVDVPSDRLQLEQVDRLTEGRLDALEARLEAELRLGRSSAVIAELRLLTAEHPGRERFWAQLMTALYGSGRQCEALAVYREVRAILAEDIGVEPGSELREVHQRILRADAGLAEQCGRSRQVAGLQTGLLAGDEEAVAPPLSIDGLKVTPFQVPPQEPGFVGRIAETAELVAELSQETRDSPCVVVVSGQPGVGKSALVGRVARLARSAAPAGTLFADLRGTDRDPASPRSVLRAFLLTLGVPAEAIPAETAERTALYRSVLVGRRVLVVLDNARDGAQVRPLLPADPANATLITSRSRLADLIGARQVELEPLTGDEAQSLLSRIVGPERLAVDPAAARTLAAACGRLPLALRICAARLSARPLWTVRYLADRLTDSCRLFDELRLGSLDVRAALTLSHDALDPAAARAFRLLAQPDVPAFWTATAAELLDQSEREAERILETLLDAHLISALAPDRYGYSDLLRAFAREQCLRWDSAQERSRVLARAEPRRTGERRQSTSAVLLEVVDGRAYAFRSRSHLPHRETALG
ncbi:BTAD domain-containing putative transcriptional regulator [Kitasatospora sp. GAS204B]|uniref:AfsR/SARP family transcriptional regulator n=1 Tax=unclassified Kitasatospora TaxID=2633591 RepID=UPI0024737CB9|nr:BTAD domain-containing putative transcriptional regulator [Kitasatospora sp. GAS204B]MDH6120704.1 DNA-binding SARP family transcriptional activator [Kitasatospora sp. GAS204B]